MPHREKQIDVLSQFGLASGDRVLFAHAHPDDAAVTNSALIARLVEAGVEVHTLDATDGTASALGDQVLVQGGWRRIEDMRSFLRLGVPIVNQHYFGMGDGELQTPLSRALLQFRIGTLLIEHKFKTLFIPGEDGFDGHPDHQAVHEAALAAGDLALAGFGRPDAIWALDPNGESGVPVNRDEKLLVVAEHETQFPDAADPVMPPETSAYIDVYERHFAQEQYSQVWPPASVVQQAPPLYSAVAT